MTPAGRGSYRRLSGIASARLTVYRILIYLLLAYLPLTGVRMVCLDSPATPVRADAGEDCDQFCLRANRPAPEGRSTTLNCILVAGCSLIAGISHVAVLPGAMLITLHAPRRTFVIEGGGFYLTPHLSHDTPPPKA